MEFTYRAYENLINMLKDKKYVFSNYRNYCSYKKSVIMRHDIDMDVKKATEMAEIEAYVCNVNSVYFVLVTSDFYNILSKKTEDALRKILEFGHDIGLHFDETRYPVDSDIIENVNKEIDILENVLGNSVSAVSMHRPSKKTLEKDYTFSNGVVNSYSRVFFKEFKYVSDSRRYWREDVESIVYGGNYNRLHILTHPFWYYDQEKTLEKTLSDWLCTAPTERYDSLNVNFSNLDAVLNKDAFYK